MRLEFLLLLFSSLSNLWAQQLSVSGTVQDGAGVVPAARVTLRDAAGKTTESTTDPAGHYNFDALRPGTYKIAASGEGFSTATTSISLAAESRTLDLALPVAGVASSVDVNDVAGRGTASGMEVPNSEIPSYVVSVSAKASSGTGDQQPGLGARNISGVMTQVQYGVYEWSTIGGITQQSGNDFLYIDGVTLTGNRSATQLNNIEEVQVLKGPNSILYGGAGAGQGGIVNLIRKKPSAARAQDIQYRLGRWGLQEVTLGTTGSVFGLQRLLYRVDGSFSHSDGWRDSGANRLPTD